MIKLTVRYPDGLEWQHFLRIFGPYIARCKPRLSAPGKKGPNSDYYRREIWLKLSVTNPETADK